MIAPKQREQILYNLIETDCDVLNFLKSVKNELRAARKEGIAII